MYYLDPNDKSRYLPLDLRGLKELCVHRWVKYYVIGLEWWGVDGRLYDKIEFYVLTIRIM